MGSRFVGVELARFGTVDRYGVGDAARSAPVGGNLVAFKVADGPCDGQCKPWTTAAVTFNIDGLRPRPLPDAGAGEYYVAAVPSGASAYLEMNRDGYRQTLSVVTGKPGAHNILMMRHSPYASQQPKRLIHLHTHTSVSLTWAGGAPTSTSPLITLNVSYAVRYFFFHGKTPHTTRNAFLYVHVGYSYPGLDSAKVLDGQYMTFVDPSGRRYRAYDRLDGPFVQFAFEIPGDVLSGTLVLGGRAHFRSTTNFPYTETMPIHRVAIHLT
jgi:hypothetical protein